MTRPGPVDPVKAFVAVLGEEEEAMREAATRLAERLELGELDVCSEPRPFGHTGYYAAEMGAALARQFFGFQRLVDPALLASSRGEAGELLYLHNHKLRQQGTGGKRTTNVRADLDRRVAESFGIHPTVTRQAAALVAALRAPRRT